MATSNGMGTGSFYGSNQKRKRKSIENMVNERIKKIKKEKIPDSFKSSITGPSTCWKTFFRQQDAFTYAKSKSSDLHVFSFESDTIGSETGQRMFLVASNENFWHNYKQLDVKKRYHYEVIAEGTVCKLYFDLEYNKEKNPNKDGSKLVDTFIKYVCVWLKNQFNIQCDRSIVLDLCASTDVKFSRHLIFQIPNHAFRNNIHVGNFVQYIISKLLQHLKPQSSVEDTHTNMDGNNDKQSKEDINLCQKVFNEFDQGELSDLLVKDKHGEEDILFCDTGVYTKNRNFRLYKSNKFGKSNPLILATENKYQPVPVGSDDYEKRIFLDSLITNVEYSAKLKILSFEKYSNLRQNTSGRFQRQRSDEDVNTDTLDGYSKSPYPDIDDFISELVKKNGNSGRIRHWTYFTHGELILYEISHYRWCENIQRQHKSNNVMLIVNMKKGVYYQKCYDPECRVLNFKSEEHLLPRQLLPSYFFDGCDDFDFGDDDEDDAEMFNAAVEAEKSFEDQENKQNLDDQACSNVTCNKAESEIT